MDEADNLLPQNDNENQDILVDNAEPINIQLTSEDYKIIIFNSLPSSLYCIIISIILCLPKTSFIFSKEEDNDIFYQMSHIISYLKIMLIIYFFYIIKAAFYYFSITKISIDNNTTIQILISLLYFLIDVFYYISTIAGYYSFKRLSLNFTINNLYKCIFIFCLIFIGIVHICLFFVSFFYILLSFIISLNSFFENESEFISNQGQLPVVLEKFLDIQKADSQHCGECYICLEDIEKGQEIITLKCNTKHFFHSPCIRKWLRTSISCPLCRQHNIII